MMECSSELVCATQNLGDQFSLVLELLQQFLFFDTVAQLEKEIVQSL